MIVCVTPNPAVDRTVFVDRLRTGAVHGGLRAVAAAGGKGINVARAASRLGAEVRAVAPVGGATGEQVRSLLAVEAIPARWIPIEGDTRVCTIVVAADGSATVLNEAGPSLRPTEWTRFVDAVGEEARDAACVTISGSVPAGVDVASYRAVLAAAATAGLVVVDTSAPALAEAVATGVGVKVNQQEAADLLGTTSAPDDPIRWAARASSEIGSPLVAITLGSAGAVLRAGSDVWHAASPPVRTVNAVASGDSFLAGLATGLVAGKAPAEALAIAVACGAVNAGTAVGADVSRDAVEGVTAQVTVERIA
jgi:1-phosphofructokinase family hexose kinase